MENGIHHPTAWNAWHGVIFASSAQQVRTFIEPSHEDYAISHGVYRWLKVPELPSLWSALTAGQMDERAFAEAVAAQIKLAA